MSDFSKMTGQGWKWFKEVTIALMYLIKKTHYILADFLPTEMSLYFDV
jgi:hypothetical protein